MINKKTVIRRTETQSRRSGVNRGELTTRPQTFGVPWKVELGVGGDRSGVCGLYLETKVSSGNHTQTTTLNHRESEARYKRNKLF